MVDGSDPDRPFITQPTRDLPFEPPDEIWCYGYLVYALGDLRSGESEEDGRRHILKTWSSAYTFSSYEQAKQAMLDAGAIMHNDEPEGYQHVHGFVIKVLEGVEWLPPTNESEGEQNNVG